MNHRQWKKNYKKQYGYNPPAYMDKRKRRKARAQQSLPCAGISVEQITQAMATFTEAVFTAAGNMCNALAQAFSRQAQAFNAVAEQYKDDKAGAIHGEQQRDTEAAVQQNSDNVEAVQRCTVFYTTHNRRREQTADSGSSTAYYGSTRRDTAAQAAGRERGRIYSVAHVLHAGLYIRADRERIEYRERYTKTLDYGSGKRAGSYGLWD